MIFSRLLFLLLVLTSLCACGSIGVRSRPPRIALTGVRYSEERLRVSDLTYFSAPDQEPAGTPTTILTIADNDLRGFIRVRKARHVRDEEFAPAAVNASAYLIARKALKHYQWGDAQSCLAQFTNEAYGHAPNQEDLAYQVAGMTTDRKYSVFCSFAVGHPRLATSATTAKVYSARDLDQLQQHPHMRLIERAPDRDFRPTITHIDDVIGRLVINE